jgi:uncharacterized protein
MSVLELYNDQIQRLCRFYKVKSLYAFGSSLTDKFNEASDIDLVVDFEPLDVHDYADSYFNLKFELEKIFNRKIDLLEEKAIRNPFFKQALNDQRKIVYGY